MLCVNLDRQLAENLDGLLRYCNRWMKCIYRQYINKNENQDITPNQYRLLHILKHSGPYKMSDLGVHVHTSFGSLTVMIDRLVAKGLVERYFLPEDRRVVMVKLSEEGNETLEVYRNDVLNIIERQMDRLDTDKKSRLLDLINEMKELLNTDFGL